MSDGYYDDCPVFEEPAIRRVVRGTESPYALNWPDRLEDQNGTTVFYGFAGNDTFEMKKDGAVDIIKDFELGRDWIEVSEWGIDALLYLTIEDRPVQTAEGIRNDVVITAGDEKLVLQSQWRPIEAADFIPGDLTYLPITPVQQEQVRQWSTIRQVNARKGTDEADVMKGFFRGTLFYDGGGSDRMFGSERGADTFVFARDGEGEVIKGFEYGDVIDLHLWEIESFDQLEITPHHKFADRAVIRYEDELIVVTGTSTWYSTVFDRLDEDAFVFG